MILTPAQKETLREMRDGIQFYYSADPQRSRSAFTKKETGACAANAVSGRTMNSLLKLGLIEKTIYKRLLYKFELTEQGKTFEL